MRALVTAIGGDLGQGVARALQRHGVEIVACDSESLHEWVTSGVAGLGVTKFARVPPASDSAYTATLVALADAWSAEVVVPCFEQELQVLALCDDERLVRLQPVTTAILLSDKLEAARLTRQHRLPFAETHDYAQWYDWERDYITKLRTKHGTQQVEQERLDGPEYTVAVWANHDTCHALALHRELRGGATYRCWYAPSAEATQVAEHIGGLYADTLGLRGSFNVQGRYVSGRGFVPFEVNPRFSSTVSMRDSMGFCDAWWSVQEALGLPVDTYQKPGVSRAVRYWAEAAQVGGEWR